MLSYGRFEKRSAKTGPQADSVVHVLLERQLIDARIEPVQVGRSDVDRTRCDDSKVELKLT